MGTSPGQSAIKKRGSHQTRRENVTLAFSPGGLLLAQVGLDDAVHLWDVATGKKVTALCGHTGDVLCVAYSPDGRQLASGSVDTTALIWDVADLKKQTGPVPRKLTEAELEACWLTLAGGDAAEAFMAMFAFRSWIPEPHFRRVVPKATEARGPVRQRGCGIATCQARRPTVQSAGAGFWRICGASRR